MSQGEEEFALHLRAEGISFEREYAFAKSIGRRWRADFFIEPDVLVEIEGGIWMRKGGGHSHPMHIEKDIEKYNAASGLGYRVFRFMPDKHVKTGEAIRCIKAFLDL